MAHSNGTPGVLNGRAAESSGKTPPRALGYGARGGGNRPMTKSLVKAILDEVAMTGVVSVACRNLGVCRQTWDKYRDRHGLKSQEDEARELFYQRLAPAAAAGAVREAEAAAEGRYLPERRITKTTNEDGAEVTVFESVPRVPAIVWSKLMSGIDRRWAGSDEETSRSSVEEAAQEAQRRLDEHDAESDGEPG